MEIDTNIGDEGDQLSALVEWLQTFNLQSEVIGRI